MNESNKLLDFLGNRIRTLRKEKGFSQEQLAFRCHLDRTYISDIERGRRNISIINLHNIADALDISLSTLFEEFSSDTASVAEKHSPDYRTRKNFSTFCGFTVTSDDVAHASIMASNQLRELPLTLFQSIDLKALSGMVGALFATHLAKKAGAIINPIEKGHPDIIPNAGAGANEELLRNYPDGLEIKSTVGNVAKGSHLQTGEARLSRLTNLTWQAHHREVERLLGLVIDFAGQAVDGNHYPIITAAFYAGHLEVEDWAKISGTTGRNTKVTGMRVSGKKKMGAGWLLILNKREYQQRYGEILSFSIEENEV